MIRAGQLVFPADKVEQALALVEELCLVCENILETDCHNCAVHTAKRALSSLVVYEVPQAEAPACGTGGGCNGCGR